MSETHNALVKAMELGDVKSMPVLLARSRDLIGQLAGTCDAVKKLES